MKPKIRLHKNGRISFPGVVEYCVRHQDGRVETLPLPPNASTHPAASLPVPLSSVQTAKMMALGEINPLPSSLPFRALVLDLVAYDRLAGLGWLYHPRHTGSIKKPEAAA